MISMADLRRYAISRGKRQEVFDRFVGCAIAVALAVGAVALVIWFFVDLIMRPWPEL